ncbi:MAG: CRTAC1 family protein [Bryobacterales bacterium]|nr:CRTAC1 family protein [Bryobacterales bacterium]
MRVLIRLAAAFAGIAVIAWTQGVSSRAVKPQPRGKASGLPFRTGYVDVAAEAGLTHPVIYGGDQAKQYILETVGCGVAWIDYDHDGWLDIFLLNGTRMEGAPVAGVTNRLYRNERNGKFTDVTEKAGLTQQGWAGSVTAGDYDNNGYPDLFITQYGQNLLYRNNGDGTFTDTTAAAGLLRPETHWGGGAAFADIDRDGDLDLFVANYLIFDLKRVPKPGQSGNCNWKGVPVNCGPRGLPPDRHQLYRNDGGGKFTDISAASGVGKAGGSYGMTVVPADLDGDGWTDFFVACDSTPSFFFRNNRDGTFSESGLERGIALNEDGMEQAGMGVGLGDYNLDGHLDLFKTHFADDTNVLYRNDGKGNFDDVTIPSGLGVETRYIGWGAAISDLDNDGLPDLFAVTGNVYPEIEKRLPAYPWRTPRVVFRSLGLRFEELFDEAGPAIAQPHASRGAAFGDYDNDGDVDAVIVNLGEPPTLLRNELPKGSANWLTVALEGTRSNRSAIGARVTARYAGKVQAQEVTSQGSFYSVNDPRLHFGLGAAAVADLEIRWPDGRLQRLPQVKAGQILAVKEP